jgi:hypothetical protein
MALQEFERDNNVDILLGMLRLGWRKRKGDWRGKEDVRN